MISDFRFDAKLITFTQKCDFFPKNETVNSLKSQVLSLKLLSASLKSIKHKEKWLVQLPLFLIVGLCLSFFTTVAVAQVQDTLKKRVDTLKIDKKRDIETTVVYYAEDSIITDVITQEIYLYGNAKIKYGDIELDAAFITFDQQNNLLFATGKPDSLGRFRGVPKFKQGSDAYESDTIKYNFKTQKAIVIGIVTQQGEGYVTMEKGKKADTGEMYGMNGRYTTCNLKHPHWYIQAGKIKMIPDKQVVSGPFNMVIADIPTPLGFFMGIFPFTEKRKSGLVVPVYGEVADRGFYLRQGGYYWAINDYMAADILGEIYTNGSWGLNLNFQYKSRYRYNGNFNIRYGFSKGGDEGTETEAQDFWINWSHAPVPRGNSSFSASVNFGTQNFNSRRDFNAQNQLSNSFNSAISYNTRFNLGVSQATLSISLQQDQNTSTGVMNVTLPSLNFGINRIYLFKNLRVAGKKVGFLDNMNISYSFNALARFTNAPRSNNLPFAVVGVELPKAGADPIQPVDFNLANLPEIAQNAQIGGVHSIPISTTVNVLKHFRLSPSFNYREAWYPYKLDYAWDESEKAVRVDTLEGFKRVYSYSASANLTTQIYGIFLFDKKEQGRKLQAIRHTIIPNIGISYNPDLSAERFGSYRFVQTDSLERTQFVSRYLNFNPGAPVSTNESGVLNFSVQNIFEAKVKSKNDSIGTEKIKLLDNLSFSGNYNLVADSMNLSNIAISARTKLLNFVDFSFGGTLDPYQYQITKQNADGSFTQQRIGKYLASEGKGLAQLNQFTMNVGMNFTPESFRKQTQQKAKTAQDNLGLKNKGEETLDDSRTARQLEAIQQNPEMYVDFDIPWTLNLNYNLYYSKVGFFKSDWKHYIDFSGDLSITKTWKLVFRSGYDLTSKQLSYTNIDITKNLHCWEMSFNWVPFGQFQSYSFDLRVKASILQDLKVSRRRTWYDRDLLTR
jgi:hypothetical protein